MYTEARKLHLIEELLKVKNDAVLLAVERVLRKNKPKSKGKELSIYDFAGILSHNEAEEMRQAIKESCETINEDDWK